jgi:hypothetical protein
MLGHDKLLRMIALLKAAITALYQHPEVVT